MREIPSKLLPLPPQISKTTGVNQQWQNLLAVLNDNGWTFNEIADVIEVYL